MSSRNLREENKRLLRLLMTKKYVPPIIFVEEGQTEVYTDFYNYAHSETPSLFNHQRVRCTLTPWPPAKELL